MKLKTASLLILTASLFFPSILKCSAKPSTLDLVGRWDSVIEFGKFRFKMIVKVTPTEDGKRVKVTLDNPEQGIRNMPVGAFLFNSPEVRIEFDQLGTAFNGRLSEDGKTIAGEFEEGPGGRAIKVVFTRNTDSEKPEPPKTYTFAAGEAPDIRGYWKGSIEPRPGMVLRLGLKIGRLPDGAFQALMDSLDQGASDIPASSVTFTNGAATLEWQGIRLVFESKLSADGNVLSGDWKQGPKPFPISFKRVAKPATLMPDGISFVPDKNAPEDVRGEWKGTLDVGGNKLRLLLKVGKTPDGSLAGSLVSLDQGSVELPMTGAGYTNPVVKFEFKAIQGSYTATLNKAGTELEGKWEQMGNPIALKMQRAETAEGVSKP